MSAELLRNNARFALLARIKEQTEQVLENAITTEVGVLKANIGMILGLQESVTILDECYRNLNR